MSHGKFATLITCMDGRVQDAGNEFMKKTFNIDYVDVITEPGPNKILSENNLKLIVENTFKRVDVSVFSHGSDVIAVAGHYDCAGNPVNKETQDIQTANAAKLIKAKYPDKKVIGLWIDKDFKTVEIIYTAE
ncbi:MAG: carbonic anhydrase [Eubacteriaceae bacterium]